MTRLTENFRSLRFLTLVALLAAGRVALAEAEPSDYAYEYTSPTTFHQPVSPYPVEMGFYQDHASTALEGALRGKAAVIQALGNFQLSDSQARILREQARALDRDNDLRQTQALHLQQKMWRDAREEARAHHEARVAEGKAKLAERRLTVYRAAYRLSPSELNPITGQITWPVALRADKFAARRAHLEELFRQHVGYGDPQPGIAEDIARSTDELSRALRTDIATLPRDQYLAAQKFLRGLKFEALAQSEAA
jgi:hypothetical protein